MSFKKGKNKTGGRKSGTANKTTNDMRLQFQHLFENNFDNLQNWFDKVGKDNPQQAISLFLRLSKFILPELQNVKIEDGRDIVINWHEETYGETDLSHLTYDELLVLAGKKTSEDKLNIPPIQWVKTKSENNID